MASIPVLVPLPIPRLLPRVSVRQCTVDQSVMADNCTNGVMECLPLTAEVMVPQTGVVTSQ
jgi:hypothetical protein